MTSPIGGFLSRLANLNGFPSLRLPLLTDQQNGQSAQGADKNASAWSGQVSNVTQEDAGAPSYKPLDQNRIGLGDIKISLNAGKLGNIDFNISNIRGDQQEQPTSAFQIPLFIPGSKIFSLISNTLQSGGQDMQKIGEALLQNRFSPLR